MSDESIWEAFRMGNHDALEYMYNTYVRDLYNYGYQVQPDEVLVKDGIQEVFINLWRNRENLSQRVAIKYYLFKALRNQLLKYIARSNKGQRVKLTEITESVVWENDHEHELIVNELSRKKTNCSLRPSGNFPPASVRLSISFSTKIYLTRKRLTFYPLMRTNVI